MAPSWEAGLCCPETPSPFTGHPLRHGDDSHPWLPERSRALDPPSFQVLLSETLNTWRTGEHSRVEEEPSPTTPGFSLLEASGHHRAPRMLSKGGKVSRARLSSRQEGPEVQSRLRQTCLSAVLQMWSPLPFPLSWGSPLRGGHRQIPATPTLRGSGLQPVRPGQ